MREMDAGKKTRLRDLAKRGRHAKACQRVQKSAVIRLRRHEFSLVSCGFQNILT
jgi:hypothetical protein